MKTPRDILFEKHQNAGPKLDAIRQSVVVAASRQSAGISIPKSQWSLIPHLIFPTFWRELILPSRRVWSGLAATWLILIFVNLAERDPASSIKGVTAPVMMSSGEQQRLMNELLADRAIPADADRPKTFSPKPHTEKIQPQTV